MKLYIVRHGIAYEADSQTTDSQRALTTQGREKINKIAYALKKLGLQPNLILSSPYVQRSLIVRRISSFQTSLSLLEKPKRSSMKLHKIIR